MNLSLIVDNIIFTGLFHFCTYFEFILSHNCTVPESDNTHNVGFAGTTLITVLC